jgi:hypothetical protein
MEIVQPAKRVEQKTYSLEFEWNDTPGAGFGFDCDKDGNVYLDQLTPVARENLNACLCGIYDVRYVGVVEYVNRYTEPAVGRCNRCGELVTLRGFTNTCGRCGADYNLFGQMLGPRSLWGEETGESLDDILRIR